MSEAVANLPLRFGPGGRFELQPLERRLLVDGQTAPLGARAFDLLLELSSRPGELRSKNELIEAVWPGVVVEEGNLATQISALRKVLGGDVIATIPGRGYRFAARPADPSGEPDAPMVHGVRAEGRTTPASPALAPQTKLRTNLPAELPLLFGRDEDLATLDRLTRSHSLVTLVGPGGTGKTRLAQAFLHRQREVYRHGVCWVDLDPISDPQALVLGVAAALGLNLGSGDALQTLCALCAPLEMLVALDNAEHLLEATAQAVQAILEAAPQVRLLVTSQAPLQLRDEQQLRIGGLAVPSGAVEARAAQSFGAVALFVERVQALDSRWRLTDENAGPVIEVCSQLDGLPLAIELAAARAPMLGVRRLALAMGERLRLLNANRDRTAPARQQTLRAALEWSHGFLDERERAVFRRLAVFAGSGSLRMIQQVVADAEGDLDGWAVLDALAALADRSLVTVLPVAGQDEPRYKLLDSPRTFALELLTRSCEETELRRRHLLAMADFWEAAWHASFSGEIGRQDFFHAAMADAENARAAMAEAVARGDRLAALKIGATWLWADREMPAAQRLELVEQCVAQLDDSVPPSLQVRTWIQISKALGDIRRVRALEAARCALDLLQRHAALQGDRFLHYLAWCSFVQAASVRGAGAAPEIRVEVQAALSKARELEDPRWPPHRRVWLAQAAYLARDGDSAVAVRLSREALALDLASGGNGHNTRSNLIDVELATGDTRSAAQTGDALLADLQGGRREKALAFARLNVAAVWLMLDDLPRARDLASAGWPQGRLFDMQPYWADYLALLAALERRPRTAARLSAYADAGYAAREDTREINEATAHDRACTLARAALGESEFERLQVEGRLLRDEQIEAIAFATGDSA